jgi:hypothetical protein
MVWDFTDEFGRNHSSCGMGHTVVAGLPNLDAFAYDVEA